MLAYTLLLLTVSALKCNDNLCPPDWLFDNFCDTDCNTVACKFDSPAETLTKPYFYQFEKSGCLYDCLEKCSKEQLTNNVCDPECNIPECGYDLNECNYCNDGCTEEMLGNGECNEACNTGRCNYDEGDCECSEGCSAEKLANLVCDEECNNYVCIYDNWACTCAKYCYDDYLFDGECDFACNVPACYYDDGDCECNDGCTYEMLTNDVCDKSCNNELCNYDLNMCLCATGCTQQKLLNSVCDKECNTLSCGFDNQNCECATGCTSGSIGDGVCDSACSNDACNQDGGDCGWCSSGCRNSQVGDGECQDECYLESCNYDKDDCSYKFCDGWLCSPTLLSNGECNNFECGVSNCNYDSQTCLCSEGCTPDLLANNVCDPLCNNEKCRYDGGICDFCATGCTFTMYGDGVCQDACNVETCNYDFTDCCNEVCTGDCWTECLVSECKFDEGCDPFLQDATKYTQLLADDFSKILNLNKCYDADKNCDEAQLRDFYAGTGTTKNCKSEECFGQFGQDQCCDKEMNCDLCIGTKCLKCKSGFFQLYTSCVTSCPDGYKEHTQIPKLCYPITDTSTELYPNVVYVSSSVKEDGFYPTLQEALAAITSKYTEIYLTDEVTELRALTEEQATKYEAKDVYSLILKKYQTNFKRISILTNFCSRQKNVHCLENASIIKILSPKVNLVVNFFVLSFKGVIIDGSQSLVEDCSEDFCSYCPSLRQVNSIYIDDRYNRHYNQQKIGCEIKMSEAFILLSCYSKLVLTNTDVINCRQGYPRGFIYSQGEIYMNSVTFNNIKTTRLELSGFIYQDCSPCDYSGYCVFSYINGKVQLLNNGYEYTNTIVQSGFYFGNTVEYVSFISVEFSTNVIMKALSGSDSTAVQHLIYINVGRRPITIEKCIFRKNFAAGALIYINNIDLDFSTIQYQDSIFIESTSDHVVVKSCIFENNTVNNILAVTIGSYMFNVSFTKSTIKDTFAFDCLVFVDHYFKITDLDVNGGFNSYTYANSYKQQLKLQPRSFVFSANTLINTYWDQYAIYLNQLCNIVIKNSAITSSGKYTEDLSSFTIQLIIDEGTSYISKMPETALTSAEAAGAIFIEKSYNAELYKLSFSDVECSGPVVATVEDHIGYLKLKAIDVDSVVSSSPDGGVFEIIDMNEGNLEGDDIKINNIKNDEGAGAFFITNTSINMTGLKITKSSSAITTGLLMESMSSVVIRNSVFSDLVSESGLGGGINVSFNSNTEKPVFSIQDTTFIKCKSKNYYGGAIYASYSVNKLNFSVKGSDFIQNSSFEGGSAVFIDGTINFASGSLISNCKFIANDDSLKGPMSFSLLSVLEIDSCTFTSHTKKYSVINVNFINSEAKLKITNSAFRDNSGVAIIHASGYGTDSTLELEGVTIEGNTVDNTIVVNDCTVIGKSTEFLTNTGPLILTSAYVKFIDTKFINNNVESHAGAIDMYEASRLECTRCEFTSNKSQNGGAVRVDSKSSIHISASSFTKNKALKSGSAIYISSSYKDNLIEDCTIQGNIVTDSGTIILIESKLILSNVNFSENISETESPSIITQSAELIVEDSTFSSQNATSNVFLKLSGSDGNFTNTTFRLGSADSYGGIGEFIKSNIRLVGCTFEDIETNIGSTFYSDNSDIFFEGCQGSNLRTNTSGSLIESFLGNLTISETVLSDFNGTAVYAEYNDEINVWDSTFQRGIGKSQTVFKVQICKHVELVKSTFKDNIADSDTAVMEINLENRKFYPRLEVYIVDCVFENNRAKRYTGIITGADHIEINRTTFFNNSASESDGGAVVLTCSEDVFKCFASVIDCNFTNNHAKESGGAIFWKYLEPNVFNLTFENNTAGYGSDYASYATNLTLYNNNKGSNSQLSKTIDDAASIIAGSGQKLAEALIFAVVDNYGQVIRTDNSTICTITVNENKNVTVTGESRVVAKQGFYYFNDLRFVAPPGVKIEISVKSNAFDKLRDSNGDLINYEFNLQIEVRTCQAGEAQVGKECVRCEYNSYSLKPSQACTICPDGAICYGGALMIPKSGYWRHSKDSDQFFTCPNQAACLGSPDIYRSLTGECSYGYRGNKCQACDNGFYRSGKNFCTTCPSKLMDSLRIVGVVFLLALLIWIMVRSSLKTAYQPKVLHSVYIKIFANYLQLVLLTTQLQLSWPNFVYSLFDSQKSSATMTEQIFYFDCMLTDDTDDSYKNLYFRKLIVMSFIPIILAFIAVLYWCAHYIIHRDRLVFKRQLFATQVVLFFLIHPNIVKANFGLFSCTEIMSDDLWLIDNLDIRCFTSEHSFYSVVVALPVLLVWGIGVPTMILIYLFKRKRELDMILMKLRFGFLYSGFRKSKFYWEFVILYRKMIIICCVVFIGNFSIKVQALTIMAIIACFVILQHLVQPYSNPSFNHMEMRGILCAAVTIYCGLYYLSDDLTEWLKVSLFLLMVGVNVVFLYYFSRKFTKAFIRYLGNHVPFLKKWINLPTGNDFPEAELKCQNYSEQTYIVDTEKVHSLQHKHLTEPPLHLQHEDSSVHDEQLLLFSETPVGRKSKRSASDISALFSSYLSTNNRA